MEPAEAEYLLAAREAAGGIGWDATVDAALARDTPGEPSALRRALLAAVMLRERWLA